MKDQYVVAIVAYLWYRASPLSWIPVLLMAYALYLQYKDNKSTRVTK